ncbi:MAG: hypothetical protein LBS25_01955 [Candidatus Symbiothrix sp.]|jgi:RHS repeat-associated protein|nr:hypothetical protein [Candidatus Symbiothrix sp.]
MKRFLFLPIFFIAMAVSGQKTIDLSQPETTSKTYVARDRIRLLPGFSFSSSGNKTFHAFLDEHLITNTVYQTASERPNPARSLNESYEVGSTAGAATVSPTGAALYQIPITVMPGTGGVQPNISIVYNSQSGNGLVGYGWSLNVVSAITRTGKTFYHDGATAAPQLTGADNLLFDGQRLMKVSGNNLEASSVYHTEIETYQTITCKYITSKLCFEVKNKEGWTMEYGSSDDSYIKPKDGNAAYAWLLKKATDANGNYMTYTYNKDSNGEFRIRQIDYTGNSGAGLNPYNKVEFFYETRTDSTTGYIAGKDIRQSVILKRIKCSAYDTKMREYKFNYFYDGFYSKLTEVEEYGEGGIRYNSTVVDWGWHGRYPSEAIAGFVSFEKDIPYPPYADFNQDGKMDFLSYPNKSSYSTSDWATLYLSGLSVMTGGLIFEQQTAKIPLYQGFLGFLFGDINGDGYTDVVRMGKLQNAPPGQGCYQVYDVWLYNGESFSPLTTNCYPAHITSESYFNRDNRYVTGDFNGDGKDEVLGTGPAYDGKRDFFYYGGSNYVEGDFGITWGGITDTSFADYPNDRFVLNFNGNAKSDLLVLDQNGCRIYEKTANNTFSQLDSSNLLKNSDRLLFGDFNGDELSDILVKRNNEYYILISTGVTFIKKTLNNPELTTPWFTADFNRDGKSDVIMCSQNANKDFVFKIGVYNGEIFHFYEDSTQIFPTGNITFSEKQIKQYFQFADFTGDGMPELCYTKPTSSYIKYFAPATNVGISTIVNGLNHKTTFSYHSLSNFLGWPQETDSYTFPVGKFLQPMYVVGSIREQKGILDDLTYYSYKDGRVHKQGKGFLGFKEVTVSCSDQNRRVTTQYSYDSTYYNVYPVKQTVTTVSGDSISRSNFENSYYTTGISKVIFPYLSKQTDKDCLTGLTKQTQYFYTSSNYGNPHQITETQGNLVTTTTNTWAAKNSSYKNRITQQTVAKTGFGTSFSETKKFDYDHKARLTRQINFLNHAKSDTIMYCDYDSIGNPWTMIHRAAGCPTVTTTSAFDGTGRFALTQTDPLGNVSSAQFNSRTGAITLKTGIDGLTTSYRYDGFGRMTRETTPFGEISHNLNWDTSAGYASYALYKTTDISPVSGTTTVWYDASGRDVKTETQGFSGTVVSEKEYNYDGSLYSTSLPGYGSASNQYIEYGYDNFGRLHTETNIGRTTTYNYNGLTTSITTPDGKTTSQTLNNSGLLQTSTDAAGGTVTYSYNSLGKPVSITSNNTTTYIKYDNRGFQSALKDPNLTDSIKYSYNAYGQLTSQTNARNQTTSYLYDAAGRITQETSPERTLTYQYVPSGNGIGQLQTITQGATVIQSHAYTPKGQLASVTENVANSNYATSYTYNSNGQVTEKQTPSDLRVGYQYTNGMLSALRNADNNALLWQADSINALGQITRSTLSNGMKRAMNYDGYHQLSQLFLTTNGPVVDQINYQFNPLTGNLTQRNDSYLGRNELFGYDNLDRLNSVRLNNGAVNQISYFANGNIQSKFDVGTYEYDNNNHALSGISNKVSSYNPANLEITNTSYNRVNSITQPGSVEKDMLFTYGADKQRCMSRYYENGSLKQQIIYLGDYEKIFETNTGTTKEYDYICTPEGISAIAIRQSGARSFYSVHTDHLGSLRAVLTAGKSIHTGYYYDAWGKQTKITGTEITRRGYLGQEHLPEFGLINLNARLYDPVLGRFLAIDPYVQQPDYTQSFNRYAYGLNNPMVYSDPNGEFWQYIVAGLFFAGKWYYEGYKANGNQTNIGKWNQLPDFYIGYSRKGNSFYAGSGWNGTDSAIGFGFNFGEKKVSFSYFYEGEIHIVAIERKPTRQELYPNHFLPYQPNAWEQFRDEAILSRIVYNFLDVFWVYGTGALGGYENARHLGGRGADRTEFENAGVFSWLSLFPVGAAGSTTTTVGKTGTQFTKSNLKLGQQMHKSYKVGADGIKEFRLPSGKRIDFLDIKNSTIYELKPFNPRAMQQGQRQLNMYMQELQTMPQFKGINWKTVLDTY